LKGKGKDEADSTTVVDVTVTEELLEKGSVQVKSPRFIGADRASYCIFVTAFEDEGKQKALGFHHQVYFVLQPSILSS
jgi:hypothetical protein